MLIAAITIVASFTGISAQAVVDPPCWTSFNPPAPQGGPMKQYYRNCNPFDVVVDTGFRTSSGQINYNDGCRPATVNNWIFWDHQITRPGSNYQTVLCAFVGWVYSAPGPAEAPCWTSFFPAAPNGGRMSQRYRNCNEFEINVGPVHTNSSGQITVIKDRCKRVQPGEVWKWDFDLTVQGVNYSTAICNLTQ
ncbi:hypothetical protein ACWGE0_08485 [Lentzea sp. NPDC054927]